MYLLKAVFERRETASVPFDELVIQNPAGMFLFLGEHLFADCLEQSDVTIDAHLQKQIGERRASSQPATELLRMLKAGHAGFRQWIDVDQLAAITLGLLQRREHARMIS